MSARGCSVVVHSISTQDTPEVPKGRRAAAPALGCVETGGGEDGGADEGGEARGARAEARDRCHGERERSYQ